MEGWGRCWTSWEFEYHHQGEVVGLNIYWVVWYQSIYIYISIDIY